MKTFTGEVISGFEERPYVFDGIDAKSQWFFIIRKQNKIYYVNVKSNTTAYSECEDKLNSDFSSYKGTIVKIEFSRSVPDYSFLKEGFTFDILLDKIYFNYKDDQPNWPIPWTRSTEARPQVYQSGEHEHFTLDQFKATDTYEELAVTTEEESVLRVAVVGGRATVDDWVIILKVVRGKRETYSALFLYY